MAFIQDPRLRQRWNQISHNAETVTENAAAGIWSFQHNYINPASKASEAASTAARAYAWETVRREPAARASGIEARGPLGRNTCLTSTTTGMIWPMTKALWEVAVAVVGCSGPGAEGGVRTGTGYLRGLEAGAADMPPWATARWPTNQGEREA